MDIFQRIIGLPNNNIHAKYVHHKLYGLAIISQVTDDWEYNIGTLPYLYGIYITFSEMTARFEYLKENFRGHIFFHINDEGKPIEIINTIETDGVFPREIGDMNPKICMTLYNLSYISDINIPVFEFEIFKDFFYFKINLS